MFQALKPPPAMLNHSEQTPNVTNASIPEFHPVPVAEQLFQVV